MCTNKMYATFLKRGIDFVLSLLALVVLSPLMIVLMIVGAVKMKGNPFFTQARPGKDERIFRLVKFRTMTNEKGPDGELLPDEVRLNGYGKFLRATSLDELPELVNILKGDMALVGPRPLIDGELEAHGGLKLYQKVKPGITGWWACNGRSNIDYRERLELEYYYVKNCSFYLDVLVIFRTIIAVLSKSGAK